MHARSRETKAGFLTQVGRVTEGLRLLTEQYGDFMADDLSDLHATLAVLEDYLSGLHDSTAARTSGD